MTPLADADPLADVTLSAPEAALRFGFSRNLVHKWAYEGRLDKQPDGKYRYRDIQRVDAEVRATGKAHRGPRDTDQRAA